MLVFTKTCARDAERVAYQAAAVAVRGWTHILLVEAAEADAVRERLRDVLPVLSTARDRTTSFHVVEEVMPEAMRLRSPYLRQMYCKLVAPTLWGDMLQIDSDMCPYAAPGWVPRPGADEQQLPRWFRVPTMGSRLEAVQAWSKGYRELLGLHAPPVGWHADYMDPCKGWWITQDLATTLLRDLDAVAGSRAALLGRLEAVFAAGQLSEYQILGLYARHYMPDAYAWRDGTQPAWCHHFTSAEELTPEQRRQLAEAGAL